MKCVIGGYNNSVANLVIQGTALFGITIVRTLFCEILFKEDLNFLFVPKLAFLV